MQPLVVCESAQGAADTLTRLEADGWTLVRTPPDAPWDLAPLRLAVSADAGTGDGSREALLAAMRGAAVVLVLPRDGTSAARLVEDLSRLGSVVVVGDADGIRTLSREQRSLLDLLADGTSMAEAACAVNLSRRTAHRRLREARDALGVSSTVEAIALTRD